MYGQLILKHFKHDQRISNRSNKKILRVSVSKNFFTNSSSNRKVLNASRDSFLIFRPFFFSRKPSAVYFFYNKNSNLKFSKAF
jgi:hypothetical protein